MIAGVATETMVVSTRIMKKPMTAPTGRATALVSVDGRLEPRVGDGHDSSEHRADRHRFRVADTPTSGARGGLPWSEVPLARRSW